MNRRLRNRVSRSVRKMYRILAKSASGQRQNLERIIVINTNSLRWAECNLIRNIAIVNLYFKSSRQSLPWSGLQTDTNSWRNQKPERRWWMILFQMTSEPLTLQTFTMFITKTITFHSARRRSRTLFKGYKEKLIRTNHVAIMLIL